MSKEVSAERIRVLERMGIDVWRTRHGSAAPLASTPSRVADLPRAESRGSVAASMALQAERPDAAEKPGPHEAVVEPPAPERVPSSPPVAPFTVLCLKKQGVLLLAQPGDMKLARRFAADLLSAVSGVWGGESQQLIFQWPQPGIDNSLISQKKALSAFVSKQIADNGSGMTLLAADVVERLGKLALPDECLIVAPVDELMTSGKLKRALWEEIGQRMSS